MISWQTMFSFYSMLSDHPQMEPDPMEQSRDIARPQAKMLPSWVCREAQKWIFFWDSIVWINIKLLEITTKKDNSKRVYLYKYMIIHVYSIFSIFFYFRLAMLFLNNFRPVQEKYASCCLPDWSICKISGVVDTSIIKRDGKTAWAVAGPASPRRMTLVSRRWWATTQRKVGSHIFRKWFLESTHTIEKAQN